MNRDEADHPDDAVPGLDPALDPELDPELDKEVRALLSDAAVTEPMPAEVAARLDDVLAELVAQRDDVATQDEAPASPGTLGDLAAARRRRRTWVGAAAAAVVVVAAGATLPGLLSGDNGDPGDTDVSVADRVDTRERPTPESPSRPSVWAQAAGPVVLTRDGLADQVEAHLDARDLLDGLDAPAPTSGGAAAEVPPTAEDELGAAPRRRGGTRSSTSGACAWSGAGTREPATLDGERATLVTRRTAAGTVVRVVTCADGRSTVAARLVVPTD